MTQVELVKKICKERKISIHKLETDCGFANGYISQLKKGVFPTDRALIISQYLSIPRDAFLSIKDSAVQNDIDSFSPDEREFLSLLKAAEPEARQFVLSILKRSAQASGPRE